jgi:hypothetical protein
MAFKCERFLKNHDPSDVIYSLKKIDGIPLNLYEFAFCQLTIGSITACL